MTNRYLWVVGILIAVIVLVIGRGACGVGVQKKGTKNKTADEGIFKRTGLAPVPVVALILGSREIPFVVSVEGKTEATDRHQAKAPADVKIQKFFVEEGGRVQPGDALVGFDDERIKLKLNLARAEIKEAEAEIDNANYLEKNRDQLLEDGKISELEADGLDERTSLYQAKLERAKAEVELYEHTSELDQLNSPIGGIVAKREGLEGSNVREDQVLVEVVRLDPIYFAFRIPIDSVAAIEKDAEIGIKFPGLQGQEFSGEIALVGTDVGTEGRGSVSGGGGVEVKIKVSNPDLTLKADMGGTVVIRTQGRRKIIPLPETALVRGDRTTYVYRIDGNKARKVAVELGEPYNGQPTVTRGLSEGELIVASSEEDLRDGDVVEVSSTKSAEK